jgi:hypothetical protein
LEEEMQKLSRWMTAVCATALLTGYGGISSAQAAPEGDDVDINVDTGDGDDVNINPNDVDEYGYDGHDGHNGNGKTGHQLMSGFGTSVQIGGGVFGFSDPDTVDFMDPGGSWTARLVFGTRLPLAVEAAYIGTANNISALGLDANAILLSNGVEGAVRWNIMSTIFRKSIDPGYGHIDPYIFGGIAYRRYSLVNDDFNTSSINENDNVGEVPFGGGLAWMMGGFALDVRGEYRVAFSDHDLFGDVGSEGHELNTWNASARLGWEF